MTDMDIEMGDRSKPLIHDMGRSFKFIENVCWMYRFCSSVVRGIETKKKAKPQQGCHCG